MGADSSGLAVEVRKMWRLTTIDPFGGVETAPARAGQVDLGPRVQLMLLLRVAKQVAAYKPGRNAHTPAGRHEQRRVIAAGAFAQNKGLLRRERGTEFPDFVGKFLNGFRQTRQEHRCLPVGFGRNLPRPGFYPLRYQRPV